MGVTSSQIYFPADQYTQSRTAQTDFRAHDLPRSLPQTQYLETGQTQVFPVQTQVVRQTTGITSVVPVQGRRSQSNASSNEVKFWFCRITLFRVLSILSSIGVLIAAAIAVSASNEVDDLAGREFENTSSYRGAAGWLVFVGCAALIFHAVMIAIQILYFKCSKKEHFKKYQFMNVFFSIIFALAFLAGGVPNAIFAGDNSEVLSDVCFFAFNNFDEDEFCDSLGRLRDTEIASAVLSFISMLFFIILSIFTLCTDCTKEIEPNNQNFLQSAAPYPSTSATRYVPPTVFQPSAPQSAQTSAPQSAEASVQPSAPPSYTSVNPPSYDTVVNTEP